MTYTKDNLEEAVRVSQSVSDVARFFKVRPVGGTLGYLRKLIDRHGIDTSHFVGQAHAKGKTSSKRKTAKEVLQDTGKMQHGHRLKRSLIEIGRTYQCEGCGLGPSWNGQELTLEVDHVNGKNTDHRAANLRFLCPNCHSQMPTSGSKNIKFQKEVQDDYREMQANFSSEL